MSGSSSESESLSPLLPNAKNESDPGFDCVELGGFFCGAEFVAALGLGDDVGFFDCPLPPFALFGFALDFFGGLTYFCYEDNNTTSEKSVHENVSKHFQGSLDSLTCNT